MVATADWAWCLEGGRMVVENHLGSVIDHLRKLHIHSVLGCCGGRVVEILQHRVCTCIHARTYYITELSHVGKLREVREVRGS